MLIEKEGMTHSKIFNQVESDAHQVIGDIKIQEICKRYSFGNKQFLNKIKISLTRFC